MPRKRKPDLAELAKAELARRSGPTAITAEALCGAHGKQLAYLLSTALYVIALCSRRAGKTWANMVLLLLTSLNTAGVTSVYIGITERQVRNTAVKKIWLPLLKKLGVQHDHAGDTTTFANGSVVHFGSLDDERHVDSWLGDSLAGGVCIIDEVQSASSDLLEAVERVIEPALSDTTPEHPIPGRLIWSGTFPEFPVGRLYDLFSGTSPEYERHTWSRFDNPFLTDQRAALDRVLRRLNATGREAYILRDWHGVPTWDQTETAFGFRPDVNLYDPPQAPWASTPFPPGTVMATPAPAGAICVVGADAAGKSDRYAIVVWALVGNVLYHVFEWITPRKANAQRSQANAVLGFVNNMYPNIVGFVRDDGSAAVNDDTLLYEYEIANVQPAVKSGLKDRVDRFRDLLFQGRAFVMKGSALAEDLTKANWSTAAREKGQWKWDPAHHPDASDAALYALPLLVAPNTILKNNEPTSFEEQQKILIAKLLKSGGSKVSYGPKSEGELGYGESWRRG